MPRHGSGSIVSAWHEGSKQQLAHLNERTKHERHTRLIHLIGTKKVTQSVELLEQPIVVVPVAARREFAILAHNDEQQSVQLGTLAVALISTCMHAAALTTPCEDWHL